MDPWENAAFTAGELLAIVVIGLVLLAIKLIAG